MPDQESNGTQETTAPYLPFPTFLTALDRLAPEPPHVLDKRLYNSLSGAVQSQIFVAFRFLGLIDTANRVQIPLETLAKSNESQRKDELSGILQQSYPEVFQSSLLKATPKHLESIFEQNYHVWGDTCRKAVTFFIKAAQYSGVPLSTYLTSRKGRSPKKKNGVRAPKTGQRQEGAAAADSATVLDASTAQKTSKFLTLQTGDAELGLTVKFDPFTISESDRKYIFEFIDKMNTYNVRKTSAPTPNTKKDDPFAAAKDITDDDDVPF